MVYYIDEIDWLCAKDILWLAELKARLSDQYIAEMECSGCCKTVKRVWKNSCLSHLPIALTMFHTSAAILAPSYQLRGEREGEGRRTEEEREEEGG